MCAPRLLLVIGVVGQYALIVIQGESCEVNGKKELKERRGEIKIPIVGNSRASCTWTISLEEKDTLRLEIASDANKNQSAKTDSLQNNPECSEKVVVYEVRKEVKNNNIQHVDLCAFIASGEFKKEVVVKNARGVQIIYAPERHSHLTGFLISYEREPEDVLQSHSGEGTKPRSTTSWAAYVAIFISLTALVLAVVVIIRWKKTAIRRTVKRRPNASDVDQGERKGHNAPDRQQRIIKQVSKKEGLYERPIQRLPNEEENVQSRFETTGRPQSPLRNTEGKLQISSSEPPSYYHTASRPLPVSAAGLYKVDNQARRESEPLLQTDGRGLPIPTDQGLSGQNVRRILLRRRSETPIPTQDVCERFFLKSEKSNGCKKGKRVSKIAEEQDEIKDLPQRPPPSPPYRKERRASEDVPSRWVKPPMRTYRSTEQMGEYQYPVRRNVIDDEVFNGDKMNTGEVKKYRIRLGDKITAKSPYRRRCSADDILDSKNGTKRVEYLDMKSMSQAQGRKRYPSPKSDRPKPIR